MLKVAKFGGSSMADAKQFEKVRDIVRADPARKVIVVSASGKRSADDHKLTDLLYLCYAPLQYGVSCDAIFQMICDRYIAIRDECGLNVDIEAELDVLRRQMRAGISEEELVSRGEYFSALLMADYLGYSFLDAELWVRFQFDGSIDKAPTKTMPIFDFVVPTALPGVDPAILDPRDTYKSAKDWEVKAEDLANRFVKNFVKFTGNEEGKKLVTAGPKVK